MNLTKEEIMRKHLEYGNPHSRQDWLDDAGYYVFRNHINGMLDEYAKQEAISFANFLSHAEIGRKTIEQLWKEYMEITKPV